MDKQHPPTHVLLFSTRLGWMGVVWAGQSVRACSFGHDDPISARLALEKHLGRALQKEMIDTTNEWEFLILIPLGIGNQLDLVSSWALDLIRRLRAYADGKIVDFTDVPVDPGPSSPFQARVYALCRQIPYGRTMTYGQLARQAGSPRAARAVGQCLARNSIPILIPCHRVVGAGGQLVGFTAPGGLRMKKRLLQLEATGCQHGEPFQKIH